LRAVTYNVGTDEVGGGGLSRLRWDRGLMRGELDAVRDGLYVDAVSIFGTRHDRLADTAGHALRHGLHVAVQPRLYDRPPTEVLDHLAAAARDAERLRERHTREVLLILGCEHVLFTPGITPGADFFARIEHLSSGTADLPAIMSRLNAFLAEAVAVARRHFRGRISYAAVAGLESVDWNPFDIVGIDYYDHRPSRENHLAALTEYQRWNKPVAAWEFGCATFTGAPEMGGMGWNIVDYTVDPPVIRDGYVRDEQAQARHLANMIETFQRASLFAAAPYTFIAPAAPHLPADPQHDYDTASFALCATLRRHPADDASPYVRRPKAAYHALAHAYRR
jgi:hypothetical protein